MEIDLRIDHTTEERKPKRVMPPPPLAIVHMMKHRVPHRRFYIRSVIFIQPLSGAAISSADLERLPDFEVVCKFTFVFVAFSI